MYYEWSRSPRPNPSRLGRRLATFVVGGSGLFVAVDALLQGGVAHGPELDDFAVAVGEHVSLLGRLAVDADAGKHDEDVVAQESLGRVVKDFSVIAAQNWPTFALSR